MSRFKNKVGGAQTGSLVFVKPADLNRAGFIGIVAEGQFVESLPNHYNEDKNDFKIVSDVKLEFSGVDAAGERYSNMVEPGDTIVVNGAGNLGYWMSKVNVGDLCQISYIGMQEATSGRLQGKEMHSFEIAYGSEE